MASTKPLRIACIGAGYIARAAHCPCLSEMDDVERVGICDVDLGRAKTLAETFGFGAAYGDYRTMLKETSPDVAYVMLPPHVLGEVIPYCLEAGLDLLIEKPPGMTPTQTRYFACLAEQKDRLTMVAFNRRFIPLLVEARRRIEECGPIHLCSVTYVKDYQRQFDPHKNGGCDPIYLDAIHPVDALRWLGGEVKNVRGAVRAVDGTDPNTFAAVLEFESGALGLLNTSWATGPRVHTFELHAVGASAYVDTNDQARILQRDAKDPMMLDAREVAGSDEFHRYYGFWAENRYFLDCVRSGRLPQTHLGDAVRSMELCEAILRCG